MHRVYKECLDVSAFRGTTSRAVEELAFLFNNYREKRYKSFAVKADYLTERQVHFKENSKIVRCLDGKGVALLCVHTTGDEWHYILAFRLEGDRLHCHDPFPRTRRFIDDDAVQMIATTRLQEPNLIMKTAWLDRTFKQTKTFAARKYILGDYDNRECLLLNRILP